MTYEGLSLWVAQIMELPVWVALIVADFTDDLSTPYSSLTLEHSYGLDLQGVVWGTPALQGTGVQVKAVPLVFTLTSTPPAALNVFGYAVLNSEATSGSTKVVDLHKYDAPQVLTSLGDSVVCAPLIRLGA